MCIRDSFEGEQRRRHLLGWQTGFCHEVIKAGFAVGERLKHGLFLCGKIAGNRWLRARCGCLLDEPVRAGGCRTVDLAGHRINLPPMIDSLAGSNERAAVESSLDDEYPLTPTGDDPIAVRKRLPIRREGHWELADNGARFGDFFGKPTILRWIEVHQPGPDDCDGAALRSERALMSCGIDAARQTANHGEAGVGELEGKLLRAIEPVMTGLARADDADRAMVAFDERSPNVENNRRIVDLAQIARILGRLARQHVCPKLLDSPQLAREIDLRLPTRNPIGDFRANSVHPPQFRRGRPQHPLGSLEHFDQLAQPHRSEIRDHVERNARLGSGHDLLFRDMPQRTFGGFSTNLRSASRARSRSFVTCDSFTSNSYNPVSYTHLRAHETP